MLKIGNSDVSNIVLSSEEYAKMYLGSNLIWEKPSADNDIRILYIGQNQNRDVRFDLHTWDAYEFIMSYYSVNTADETEWWLGYWPADFSDEDRTGAFRFINFKTWGLIDYGSWTSRLSIDFPSGTSLPTDLCLSCWWINNTFNGKISNGMSSRSTSMIPSISYTAFTRSLGLFSCYGTELNSGNEPVLAGGRFYYMRVKNPTYDYIPVLHEGVPCIKTVNYRTNETVEYLYSSGGTPIYDDFPDGVTTPPFWNEITQFAS